MEQVGDSLTAYKLNSELDSEKIRRNTPISSNELIWNPPPANTLKINVDAHCHGDGRWGLAWVVRKNDGGCLGATTRVFRARTPMEAEAMGIVMVLQSIEMYDGRFVIVESDSKVVVKAIQTRDYPRVIWGNIARIGGDTLGQHPHVSLRWIRRAGNFVAHNLARWAFSEPNKNWSANVPSHIATHIQKI